MFRSLILVEDPMASAAIEELAAESRMAVVERVLDRIPRPYELNQLLNCTEPEIVFLQTDGDLDAEPAAEEIRRRLPECAIIAVQTEAFGAETEFCQAALSAPYNLREFTAAVEDSVRALRPASPSNLWVFLPAKAGGGASTVALQTAASLTHGFGKKVLLIEGDLLSGVIGDVLGVEPKRPVAEVLAGSAFISEAEWRKSVTSFEGIDLLLTNRERRSPLPIWCEWFKLLEFTQARYDAVLVDLPEVVNDGTVEAVRRANRAWVVLTAELQSLALACQRAKDLSIRGVPGGRIELIINRWHRTDMVPKMIGEMVGQEVAAVLMNDYGIVQQATIGGRFIENGSELGKGYAALASRICGAANASTVPEKRGGFLERLGVRRAKGCAPLIG
jgi:Flp pilus assembly CpaE family ATPase